MTEQKEVDHSCPECDGTGQDTGMKPIRLGEKIEFCPCTNAVDRAKSKRPPTEAAFL